MPRLTGHQFSEPKPMGNPLGEVAGPTKTETSSFDGMEIKDLKADLSANPEKTDPFAPDPRKEALARKKFF
jgi:hypothetical protein